MYIQVYKEENELSSKELIKYWTTEVEFLTGCIFKKVKRKFRTTKNLRKRKDPPLYGLVEFWIYSRQLQKTLQSYIKDVKTAENLEIIGFLRGLIAAEGSVKLNNSQVLKEIRIGSTKKTEQKFIRYLLKLIGIKAAKAEYKNYIAISNFTNFKILKKYMLYSLHPTKKLLFEVGYKELERRKLLSLRV